MLLAYIG